MNGRLEELRSGLDAVRARIDAAAEAAGRDPAGLILVVVSKTYPADDVRLLAQLGVRDFGESRDQEAGPKAAELADLDLADLDLADGSPPGSSQSRLRWHFVGRLQSNKAKAVARYADVVHSLDRPSLVGALGAGARAAGRELGCFVQVSLDDDPARGGVRTTGSDGLAELADATASQDGLRLLGLMAVAPLGADPEQAFARLETLSELVRQSHPEATGVSAGMSGDLEAAIRHGATHLRVGSAVLGKRPRPE